MLSLGPKDFLMAKYKTLEQLAPALRTSSRETMKRLASLASGYLLILTYLQSNLYKNYKGHFADWEKPLLGVGHHGELEAGDNMNTDLFWSATFLSLKECM